MSKYITRKNLKIALVLTILITVFNISCFVHNNLYKEYINYQIDVEVSSLKHRLRDFILKKTSYTLYKEQHNEYYLNYIRDYRDGEKFYDDACGYYEHNEKMLENDKSLVQEINKNIDEIIVVNEKLKLNIEEKKTLYELTSPYCYLALRDLKTLKTRLNIKSLDIKVNKYIFITGILAAVSILMILYYGRFKEDEEKDRNSKKKIKILGYSETKFFAVCIIYIALIITSSVFLYRHIKYLHSLSNDKETALVYFYYGEDANNKKNNNYYRNYYLSDYDITENIIQRPDLQKEVKIDEYYMYSLEGPMQNIMGDVVKTRYVVFMFIYMMLIIIGIYRLTKIIVVYNLL